VEWVKGGEKSAGDAGVSYENCKDRVAKVQEEKKDRARASGGI